MIRPEYKYSELTGKIIGCAMEVHNFPGNGITHVEFILFKVFVMLRYSRSDISTGVST